jgi:hypothetical protein
VGGFIKKPGEIPAVQDRFHTLLKRRLQTEIQRNPPLFPWEKGLSEYPSELTDQGVMSPAIASASLLVAQLRQLALPIPMPETLLTELLSHCQAVVPAALKEGARLVKSVEWLFPQQSLLLNQMAGMVMVSPARGGASLQQQLEKLAGEELPKSYDVAMPTQQMTLSLLVAREILGLLTVTVSPSQPKAQRQWLTDLGMLDLQVEYTGDLPTPGFRVQAQMPCGGRLEFEGAEADCQEAGNLSIDLPAILPNQTYPLKVSLGDQDVLVFAVTFTMPG